MLFKTKDLLSIGGIDEEMGEFWPEDLCLRARKAGKVNVVLPYVTGTKIPRNAQKSGEAAFQEKYRFKTWLYTIARNVAVDYLRHQAKSAPLPYEEAAAGLADERDLEQSFLREEQKISVRQALKKLPPDYRQTLWLLFFEELSPAEAGRVLKKSPRQMKNLVYRAKGALKSELEKEGFEYEDYT